MFFRTLSRRSKTVAFRLAVWYTGVFALSSLALFGLAYFLFSSSLKQHDREITESALELYASRYESEGLSSLIEEVNASHRESLFVRVLGPGNEPRFQNMPTEWDDFDVKQLQSAGAAQEPRWTTLVGEDSGDWFDEPDQLEILFVALQDGSLLQVGRSTEVRNDILDSFRDIFAVVMFAVLALSLASGALLANRSMRPVRDLAGVLRSIRKTGRMDARVPTRQTGDDLDEMAASFNALLETIESLINRMRSALDTIAHELRTPLTRLRGVAEMTLRSNPDTEACKEALADCLEEAEQTVTMLNTLMDVAEAEAGAMKLEIEPVALPELIGSVLGLYEHVAEDKGITLHSALPAQLNLRADPRRIR
jgi:signal transduction histidine kinase